MFALIVILKLLKDKHCKPVNYVLLHCDQYDKTGRNLEFKGHLKF